MEMTTKNSVLHAVLFLLLAACSGATSSPESWRVVEVRGPGASPEIASFADGAAVVVEDDAVVLSRGDGRLRLPADVSRERGGRVSIELMDEGQGGRALRWEPVDADHARLVWSGKAGESVMELERGAR